MIVSVIGILILFQTEFYQHWFTVYLFPADNPMMGQFDRMSLEERRQYRFGNTYQLCTFIKKTLDTTKIKNKETIILLPPNDYLKSKHVDMFHLPEPAEFYYHTGLKTVWTTSPDVENANWVILPQGNNSLTFLPIQSKEQLHAILDSFKKFKPAL